LIQENKAKMPFSLLDLMVLFVVIDPAFYNDIAAFDANYRLALSHSRTLALSHTLLTITIAAAADQNTSSLIPISACTI
jgi:hypothetical protein